MRAHTSLFRKIVHVVGAVLISLAGCFCITAWNRLPLRNAAAARLAAVQNDDSFTVPVKIVRKPKPIQKRKPVRQVVTELRLAMRFKVLKRNEDLTPIATNPNASFQVGDRLQFAVRVNQEGYLYFVQKGKVAGELDLLFPDSRINDGKNYVRKNQEIVIPSNCEEKYNDEKGNCWFEVVPRDDELTIIFSREMLLDLPEQMSPTASDVKVGSRVINEILRQSGQKLQKSSLADERYTIQFANINQKDNEVLIAKIVLKHEPPERRK